MEVFIKNKDLQKLYETGKSKKYPLPRNIIDEFLYCMQVLSDAETIYDIWKDKSLQFERLKGTENSYSMRLNNKYRLEMDIDWRNQECTIGIVEVTEISNAFSSSCAVSKVMLCLFCNK